MFFIQIGTLLRAEDMLLAISLGKQTYTKSMFNKDKLSPSIESVLPFGYILSLYLLNRT